MDVGAIRARFRAWPTWAQVAVTLLAVALVGAIVAPPDDEADVEVVADASGGEVELSPSPPPSYSPSPSLHPSPTPSRLPSPGPTSVPSPHPAPTPSPTSASTWRVVGVVDGDTIDVRSQSGVEERVRIIGIDTPERGDCGFAEASDAMSRLVMGRDVVLVDGARDDRDHYDRILRYVDVRGTDAGLSLIEDGLAIARYDSRDGYGRHPRQDRYVAVDAATDDVTCAAPAPPTGDTGGSASNPWRTASCHAAYDPCVPPPSETGDLNCPDIKQHHPGGVTVDHTHGDPHGLDGDKDGHGCE